MIPSEWRSAAKRWALYVLAALVLFALILSANYGYRSVERELTDAALARRATVTRLAAATLAEKFDHLLDIGTALATRVQFRKLIANGNWAEAIKILGNVPADFPFIERITLNDSAGTLMADVPEILEVRGQNFAYRDWHQAVMRDGQRYISQIYLRAAPPRINVFVAAIPVRSDAGAVLGILVLQVRADSFFEWIRSIDAGTEGLLYLIDRRGMIAAHPMLPPQRELADFSKVPVVQQVLRGNRGIEIALSPTTNAPAVVAYEAVAKHGWGVVLEQPVTTVFAARDSQLRWLLSAYSLILLFLFATAYLVTRIALQRRQGAEERQRSADFAQRLEERRVAEAALRDSERYTRATMDALPANICVLDETGTIRSVNQGWRDFAAANGADPGSVSVGANYLQTCAAATGADAAAAQAIANAIRGIVVGKTRDFSLEYPCHSPEKQRWFIVNVNRFDTGASVRIVVLHLDITARKQLEAAQARLAAIVNSSLDTIISRKLDGTITSWNSSAERLFGYSAAEAIGQPTSLIIPADRQQEVARNRALLKQGQLIPAFDTVRVAKDGRRIDVLLSQSPLRDEHGVIAGVSVILRDINERKRAEQAMQGYVDQLQQLSRRLFEVEATERHRLARELHDSIGQNVSALNLNLSMLRAVLPTDVLRAVSPQLSDCETLLSDTGQRVRDVMADLHPPGLDELGLFAALTYHARVITSRSGIAVSVNESEPTPRLPADREIALFRIAQEALINIAKHAHATEAILTFAANADTVTLTIADNGRGFDPAAPPSDTSIHLGMVNMRERAEAIGGTLSVESAPGQGTRIMVQAPGSAPGAPDQPHLPGLEPPESLGVWSPAKKDE